MSALEKSLLELIRRTAIHLPLDVVDALDKASLREDEGTSGRLVLDLIRDSIDIAAAEDQPVCPETSAIHFYVELPAKFDTTAFEGAAQGAVAQATKLGYLQPGRIDPITDKPYKTNVGPGSPGIHFSPADEFIVRLVLKGSGGETASAQYSLPDERISAGRDLHGVRRAVLDAVLQAQGNGSGPGVLGVGIGGDRTSGYSMARAQLLRPLNERSRVTALDKLEKRIVEEANSLGVGPMGFGGQSTVLGVKIGSESRPQSSFFVSVSYIGWACRRQGIRLDPKGTIKGWLFPDTTTPRPRPRRRAQKKAPSKKTPTQVATPRRAAVAPLESVPKTAAARKVSKKKAAARARTTTARASKSTTARKVPAKVPGKSAVAKKASAKQATTKTKATKKPATRKMATKKAPAKKVAKKATTVKKARAAAKKSKKKAKKRS